MKIHIIRDGVVVNTVLASSVEAAQELNPGSVCLEATTGSIGWVYDSEAGEISAPPPVEPPPAPVPSFVTNAQARVILLRTPSGPGRTLFDDVDAACHSIGGETLAFWDYANEITRNGQLVRNLAAQLGLTDAQLDELFRQAKLIEA
jgi:hypothetical protein